MWKGSTAVTSAPDPTPRPCTPHCSCSSHQHPCPTDAPCVPRQPRAHPWGPSKPLALRQPNQPCPPYHPDLQNMPIESLPVPFQKGSRCLSCWHLVLSGCIWDLVEYGLLDGSLMPATAEQSHPQSNRHCHAHHCGQPLQSGVDFACFFLSPRCCGPCGRGSRRR